MNIEAVRALAASTEPTSQNERKANPAKITTYVDAIAARTPSGLTTEQRVTNVEKSAQSTNTIDASSNAQPPDSTAVSKPALVLAKLGQLAGTDPDAFRSLLNQGATEIQDALEAGSLQDPQRMQQIVANFKAAAAAKSASSVDATALQGSSADVNKLADALLARADAIMGLTEPPYGPWFPR